MNEAQFWLHVNSWLRGRSHLHMGDSFRVSPGLGSNARALCLISRF